MTQRTNSFPCDVGYLYQLGLGFMPAKVLNVATKLRIFSLLSDNGASLDDMVAELGLPRRTAEALLNACVSLRLIEKQNDSYANSAVAERYLVEGKDEYFGAYLSFAGEMLYNHWSHLLETVTHDAPLRTIFRNDRPFTEEETRVFTLAMDGISRVSAPLIATAIDLSAHKRLLDLGGGSGRNAVVLAEQNPQLEVLVFDMPAVVKVADDIIATSAVSSRIKTQAGNFHNEALPQGCDCILLAHILHGEGAEGSVELLQKCYEALPPGGRVLVVDLLTNEEHNAPPFPVHFALNMMLLTPSGDSFSAVQVRGFLEKAGFVAEKDVPLGEGDPGRIVVGTKP